MLLYFIATIPAHIPASMFGGAAAFGSGMNGYGGMAAATGTHVAYRPYQTQLPDDKGMIHCIGAMDQYKSKSLEEIRFEDYRKQQGAVFPSLSFLIFQAGAGWLWTPIFFI
jgi:hypothetical protein